MFVPAVVVSAAKGGPRVGGVLAICSLLASGCGGMTTEYAPADASSGAHVDGPSDGLASQGVADSDGLDGPLLGCSWPASFASLGSATGPDQCTAARTWLECTSGTDVFDGGTLEGCLSNDSSRCVVADAGAFTCQALCGPGEYGVFCHAPSGAALPTWPSFCRSPQFLIPPSYDSTTATLCCPCAARGVSDAD